MIGKIANQAMFTPSATYHYFVLDEVDRLNKDAMSILKSVMSRPCNIPGTRMNTSFFV